MLSGSFHNIKDTTIKVRSVKGISGGQTNWINLDYKGNDFSIFFDSLQEVESILEALGELAVLMQNKE